jgi:ubiquinone/menaquinone biosynthesis C-methylase UbiE
MNGNPALFDRLARPYRALEMAAFGLDLERARFHFLGRLAASRDILLLGEGDGRCSTRLAALAPDARIQCIDSSPGMIGRARRRFAGFTSPVRVDFVCDDVLSRDFSRSSFDAVATFFFLDCFSAAEVETIIARVSPALRPGSVWLFVDFLIPDRGLARLRGQAWLSLLYAFFRWQTGLRTRRLPPSEAILARAGWRVREKRDFQGGLVRSSVLSR